MWEVIGSHMYVRALILKTGKELDYQNIFHKFKLLFRLSAYLHDKSALDPNNSLMNE